MTVPNNRASTCNDCLHVRRQSLAADIRLEVASTLDQIRYLQTRTDDVSAYALPLAKSRLAALIADHRAVVTGGAA